MNAAIKGVIFDMDGVLCDSEQFICEAACRMFRETYDKVVKAEDFVPFVGAGENRYIGGVAEKYGIAWKQEEDKRRTYEIYLEIIKGRLRPLNGVRTFIEECRRRGLKLAVASSADRVKVDGNLAEIGLPRATFDAVVSGDMVERKKPFPDIFERAAGSVGVSAESCLVVEDAPNGIQAGKAAGAKCLGLMSSFSEAALRGAGADWVAKDLASVPAAAIEW